MNPKQAFAAYTASAAVVAATAAWYFTSNPWAAGLGALGVAIGATAVPVLQAMLHRVHLDAAPTWLQDSKNLGAERDRVVEHYGRLKGTLVYWKNEAAAHHRLYQASVIWSLLSGVLIPVLVQFYDESDAWSKGFMTILTTWTGFLVAITHTFKSEHRYQGMRQQESDYYDLARTFLDQVEPDDPTELARLVDRYFEDTARIRRMARRVETGTPPSGLDR